MQYDLVIIGGGPAACAAAVYAGRKQLKTALIAEEFGGQSAVSDMIYNWIGTKAIPGSDLALALRDHAKEYTLTENKAPLDIFEGNKVTAVTKTPEGFVVSFGDKELETRAVLIASGSRHRKLDVPGAKEFDNKGIMYCATCDGPLFSGQPLAVVGGGNAAFEAALQLIQYSPSVTLIHRSDNFRADAITIEKVQASDKINIVTNAVITEITGDVLVSSVTYQTPDATHILPVGALFVEIGQIPNTDFVKDLVKLDDYTRIVVDPRNQRASVDGIWAAGDVTDGLYHQNNIAAGDAVKALEDIYLWLQTGK
jgi:alkyl hydroperoxide reductase subunit F